MSKNPSVFTILFEDTAALVRLIFAFCGILAAQLFNMLGLDGAASIAIAAVLASTAVFLDRDSKSLLLGETDALDLEKAISIIVEADPAIQRANGILTVHLAPKQVIAGLRIEFQDQMNAPQIEKCVRRIEARVVAQYPCAACEAVVLALQAKCAGQPDRHDQGLTLWKTRDCLPGAGLQRGGPASCDVEVMDRKKS